MSEPNNFQKLSSLIQTTTTAGEELVRKNRDLDRKNRDLERRLGDIEVALNYQHENSELISRLQEELVRKNCYLERKNCNLGHRLGIIEEALINKNDEHDKLVAELQHKNRDLERKYYKLLNAIETEGDCVQTQSS